MEIFKTDNGFGYMITSGGMIIKQDYLPCYNGNISMTEKEANDLGEYVEQKIMDGKNPGVTKDEMKAIGIER
jgi:hypothetical protein